MRCLYVTLWLFACLLFFFTMFIDMYNTHPFSGLQF